MSDRIKTIFTCEHNREGCPYCAEELAAQTAKLKALEEDLGSILEASSPEYVDLKTANKSMKFIWGRVAKILDNQQQG